MNQWSQAQQEAIHRRDINLLVSAAAGSGKTAVLIERVVQMVLADRIDIDRLLVVTFTRAAAAEMRERTAAALMERLDDSPDETAYIQKQLGRLNQAAMMTFHSFCIQIIRNHYYLIEMEPSFRTADRAETELLQKEAVEQVLEEAYGEKMPSFLRLVEMYCPNRNDESLETMIMALHDFACSHPHPHGWLKEQVGAFLQGTEDMASSDWIKSLLKHTFLRLEYVAGLLRQAVTEAARLQGPYAYLPLLEGELSEITSMAHLAQAGRAEVTDALRRFSFGRLPASKNTDPVSRDAVRDLRDQAKKEVKRMQDQWFFRSLEGFADDHRQLAPVLERLVHLVRQYEKTYDSRKRERNVLDFSDLEHRALQILEHPEARAYYQDHYTAVFIDEYQDSNRVQEALINQIKRTDNLFMVGDVKQSIYRFRLAEPELFMEKHRKYRSPEQSNCARIDLNLNYRSHPVILESVNTIFSRVMSESLGELDYDESAALRAGNPAEWDGFAEAVCVHLLEKKAPEALPHPGNETDEAEAAAILEEWTEQEMEARLLVHQIRSLLQSECRDPQTGLRRPVRYQDITILLRAPGNQATSFVDVLTREGIPVYADVGSGFYESLEIELFINLLRVIDNQQQDIPLLSVLRSPFGHFTTEELTDIRLAAAETTYAEALVSAGERPGKLGDKVRGFLQQLDKWRRQARKLSLTDFMWLLLSDSGFFALCSALPGGRQRQANLRMLMKRAAEFSAVDDGGVFPFLTFLDRAALRRNQDTGTAKTLSENDNVIRLMSIHKSKGLEFPIVLLAGLGKPFNRRELQSALLLHRTLGLGPLFVEPDLRIKRSTLARAAIREKSRVESLSEEVRILYVAMTRAQQKLILTGTVHNLPAKIKAWSEPISTGKLTQADRVLDWLGPVWVRLADGETLRNLANVTIDAEELIEDHAQWTFHCWNRSSILEKEKETAARTDGVEDRLAKPEKWINPEAIAIFDHRFGWRYPYQQETAIPGKMSVSELMQPHPAAERPEDAVLPRVLPTPSFRRAQSQLSPVEKGTALHYFLQYTDLESIDSPEDLSRQLDHMVQKEMITQQESQAIDAGAVWQFYHSDLGCRMRSSQQLYRELPFVLRMQDARAELLQGVIDCCFMEEGGWVLIDYKSDAISAQELPRWTERYLPQLQRYSQALEMLTGTRVKEMFLYSLHLQITIRVPFGQGQKG